QYGVALRRLTVGRFVQVVPNTHGEAGCHVGLEAQEAGTAKSVHRRDGGRDAGPYGDAIAELRSEVRHPRVELLQSDGQVHAGDVGVVVDEPIDELVGKAVAGDRGVVVEMHVAPHRIDDLAEVALELIVQRSAGPGT